MPTLLLISSPPSFVSHRDVHGYEEEAAKKRAAKAAKKKAREEAANATEGESDDEGNAFVFD